MHCAWPVSAVAYCRLSSVAYVLARSRTVLNFSRRRVGTDVLDLAAQIVQVFVQRLQVGHKADIYRAGQLLAGVGLVHNRHHDQVWRVRAAGVDRQRLNQLKASSVPFSLAGTK